MDFYLDSEQSQIKEMAEQFAKGVELQERIRENLKGIGYDL